LQHRLKSFTLQQGSQHAGSHLAGAQGAGAQHAGSQQSTLLQHRLKTFTLQHGSQHAGAQAAGAQHAGSQQAGAHFFKRPASAEALTTNTRAPAASARRTTRRFMDTLLSGKTYWGTEVNWGDWGFHPSIYRQLSTA
jgi:hypothetical protein